MGKIRRMYREMVAHYGRCTCTDIDLLYATMKALLTDADEIERCYVCNVRIALL